MIDFGSNSDGIAFAIETAIMAIAVSIGRAPTVTESLSRLKHEHPKAARAALKSSNSDGIAFAIETRSAPV